MHPGQRWLYEAAACRRGGCTSPSLMLLLLLAAAAAAGSSFDSSSSSLVWRPAKYCSRHLCPVSDSRPGSCAKYKQGSLPPAGSQLDPKIATGWERDEIDSHSHMWQCFVGTSGGNPGGAHVLPRGQLWSRHLTCCERLAGKGEHNSPLHNPASEATQQQLDFSKLHHHGAPQPWPRALWGPGCRLL